MNQAVPQRSISSVATAPAGQGATPKPLLHAVLFVFGFSIIFVALGTAVSGLARLVFDLREPLARIGGVIIILFGLATMGLFDALSRWLGRLEGTGSGEAIRWWQPWIGRLKDGTDVVLRVFYTDTRTALGQPRRSGYFTSFFMGVCFSAGWTPCIGPTLGAIMALSYDSAGIGRGALLLTAYSLGLGIPFLLFALALDRATGLVRSLKRHLRTIQLLNGTMLVLIGLALATKQLTIITQWAQENDVYWEGGFLNDGTPTFFIAAVAGLLSFLSPCVFPLVPAYVLYLTGRTFSKTEADSATASHGGSGSA